MTPKKQRRFDHLFVYFVFFVVQFVFRGRFLTTKGTKVLHGGEELLCGLVRLVIVAAEGEEIPHLLVALDLNYRGFLDSCHRLQFPIFNCVNQTVCRSARSLIWLLPSSVV